MSVRLPSKIWVDALVRRVELGGGYAYIVSKGDAERGDVLVKLACLDGRAALLAPSPLSFEERQFDWLPEAKAWAEERDVDALIAKRKSYDPDLWVVEIEDRKGRHFLTEPVNGECAV